MRDIVDATFETDVLQSPRTEIVLFWAPWSGPDRIVIKMIETERVEDTVQKQILKLNVDDNPKVAQDYQITSIPTFLIFTAGRLVDRIVGALPAKSLIEFISRHPDPPPTDRGPSWIAVGMFGDKLRVVSLEPDGRYRFVDARNNSHNLLFAYDHAEALVRRDVADEFENLINSKRVTEERLHQFFERNPEFILTNDYKAAHSKIVLDRTDAPLIPDFMLEPVDQGSLCDLLELKRPDTRLFVLKKNRLRFSAAVFEAVAQLREYSRYFDEQHNREFVRQHYGLTAFKPRMFLILGRSGDVDPMIRRVAEQDLPEVVLRTYDDLLARIRGRQFR